MQTAGRAARNRNGRVILYGDEITPAMKSLINETARRRKKQAAYNEAHGIIPQTVVKEKRQTISEIIGSKPRNKRSKMPDFNCNTFSDGGDGIVNFDKMNMDSREMAALIAELTSEMLSAAEALEFERAADLRDQIRKISGKSTVSR